MFEAMVSGLVQVISAPTIYYLILGAVIGGLIGFIPGLSGIFAVAILLPFVTSMDVLAGLALLLGAHSVINTTGGITGILFSVPGTPGTAATILDGFPLTQKGEAGRALGANLMASLLGGVIGAIFLSLLAPSIRPIVLSFQTPEFFMMTLFGLSVIAIVSSGSVLKAAVAAALGLALSTVGMDPVLGQFRFTFGIPYLSSGVGLVSVAIGIFAIAEMMDLLSQKFVKLSGTKQKMSFMLEGIKDTFRHWWLVVRGAFIGCFFGALPGIGSDTINFVAYAHAKQTSKSPETFGYGNIEGVIAPESANNAKEGGSLLPTLAFGIPGSAPMALILGAFVIWGIAPGPSMLDPARDLHIVYAMVYTIVIANVIGTLMCFPLSFLATRLTNIRLTALIPALLAVCFIGAYVYHEMYGDIVIALVFGLLGFAMKKLGYSRVVMIIGIVLGGLAEQYYILTTRLYGYDFLFRPIVLIIMAVAAVFLLTPFVQSKIRSRRRNGS